MRTRMSTAAALASVALAAVAGPSVSSAAASSAAGHGSDAAALRPQLHALVAAGAPGAVLVVRDGDSQLRLSAGRSDLATGTPMRAVLDIRRKSAEIAISQPPPSAKPLIAAMTGKAMDSNRS